MKNVKQSFILFLIIFISGCGLTSEPDMDINNKTESDTIVVDMEDGVVRVNLNLNTHTQSRAIDPTALSQIESVVFVMESDNYPMVIKNAIIADNTASVEFANIRTGEWTLKAYVNNSSDQTIFYGEETLIILPGVVTNSSIKVYETSGITTNIIISELIHTPVVEANLNETLTALDVYLSCDSENALIYYTTDGSIPDVDSNLYDNTKIVLDLIQTLNAIAISGTDTSDVVSFTYDSPFFDPSPATYPVFSYLDIELKSSKPGVTFSYTTDGSEPTAGYGNIAGIGSFIRIYENTNLKIVSFIQGDPYSVSEVTSVNYYLQTLPPSFSPNSETNNGNAYVSLSSSLSSDIYFTLDGSDPSQIDEETTMLYGMNYFDYSSNHISNGGYQIPCEGDSSSHTIRAWSRKENWVSSEITIVEYNITWETLNAPTVDIPEGIYLGSSYEPVNVSLSTETPYAGIVYTIDGSDPFSSDTAIDSANDNSNTLLNIRNFNIVSDTTIRAYAYRLGMFNSTEFTAEYDLTWYTADPPSCNYSEGQYDSPITITLSSEFEDVTIYYTLDGSDPKNSLTVMSGNNDYGSSDSLDSSNPTNVSIYIDRDTQVRAYVSRSELYDSEELLVNFDLPSWNLVGLNDVSTNSISNPQIISSSNNTIYVTYDEQATGQIKIKKLEGESWVDVLTVDGECPTFQKDHNDQIYIAYFINVINSDAIDSSSPESFLNVKIESFDGTTLTPLGPEHQIKEIFMGESYSTDNIFLHFNDLNIPYFKSKVYDYKPYYLDIGLNEWSAVDSSRLYYSKSDFYIDENNVYYDFYTSSLSSYDDYLDFRSYDGASWTTLYRDYNYSIGDNGAYGINILESISGELQIAFSEGYNGYFKLESYDLNSTPSNSINNANFYINSKPSIMKLNSNDIPYIVFGVTSTAASSNYAEGINAVYYDGSSLKKVGIELNSNYTTDFDFEINSNDEIFVIYSDPVNGNKAVVKKYGL